MPRTEKPSKNKCNPHSTSILLSDKDESNPGDSSDIIINHNASYSRSEKPKKFKCPHPGCDHATREKSNLNVHIKTHIKVKDLFCAWEPKGAVKCPFSCVDPSSFLRHRKAHVRRALSRNESIQKDFQDLIERVLSPNKRTRKRRAIAKASSTATDSQANSGDSEPTSQMSEPDYSSSSGSSTSSQTSSNLELVPNLTHIGNGLPTFYVHDPFGTVAHGTDAFGYSNGSVNDAPIASSSSTRNYHDDIFQGERSYVNTPYSLLPPNVFDFPASTYIPLEAQPNAPTLPRTMFASNFFDTCFDHMMHVPLSQPTVSTVPQLPPNDDFDRTLNQHCLNLLRRNTVNNRNHYPSFFGAQ